MHPCALSAPNVYYIAINYVHSFTLQVKLNNMNMNNNMTSAMWQMEDNCRQLNWTNLFTWSRNKPVNRWRHSIVCRICGEFQLSNELIVPLTYIFHTNKFQTNQSFSFIFTQCRGIARKYKEKTYCGEIIYLCREKRSVEESEVRECRVKYMVKIRKMVVE